MAKPVKFSDCAKVFRDCEDAEKYNDSYDDTEAQKNDDEHEEHSETQNTTENPDIPEDTEDKEGAGDSESNQKSDNENTVRRKRNNKPFRTFFLNRKISII